MSDAYKHAGVDIEAGYQAVERMKKHVARTTRPEVLGGLGGFGGLFQFPVHKYANPVLVSGTDGVGTKLKLAFLTGIHHTVGIDLVAMCANDILVVGAEPLFFLDYLATSKLDPNQIEQIVAGVAEGCVQAGCALIGGETAEMPGFYSKDEYDMAGFCVGVVDQDKMIDGTTITPGDVILGLPSSGLHSNGFSLVRKLLFSSDQVSLDNPVIDQPLNKPLGEVLLTPTRIYVKAVQAVLGACPIAGMAHITGGGFIENIPRMLPENCDAKIDLETWPVHSIFSLLQKEGNLDLHMMYHTFNMGIGLVMVVKAKYAERAINVLNDADEAVYIIGEIIPGGKQVQLGGR